MRRGREEGERRERGGRGEGERRERGGRGYEGRTEKGNKNTFDSACSLAFSEE